ncbi:GNAT family N-acetyltransferase [Candidatus Peregrinibacteria bacterium]|jgi:ribosomal protein S18 acetylase RimI-like enzyme|nr:GNAT family N-acetyltransferase [Candidatus Peregrinibacteria bacterium]MBT4055584.1 GNAT family N-acetyltransferase [Candidatus Peregrinibacteria bacterium]
MLKLRKLKKDDIEALMKILGENDDPSILEAQKYYIECLNTKSPQKHNFVIEFDNKLIGTIGYKKTDNNHTITWFHVQTEFQGRGLGSKALEIIEEAIAPKKATKIIVNTGYKTAINFYEKNGYKNIKTTKNFYPSGHDQTTLEKEF